MVGVLRNDAASGTGGATGSQCAACYPLPPPNTAPSSSVPVTKSRLMLARRGVSEETFETGCPIARFASMSPNRATKARARIALFSQSRGVNARGVMAARPSSSLTRQRPSRLRPPTSVQTNAAASVVAAFIVFARRFRCNFIPAGTTDLACRDHAEGHSKLTIWTVFTPADRG